MKLIKLMYYSRTNVSTYNLYRYTVLDNSIYGQLLLDMQSQRLSKYKYTIDI